MFRGCLNTDQHSAAVMAYFAKQTKFKKFDIRCQDYAFGREAAEGFKKKMNTIPGAVVLGEDYHLIGLRISAAYQQGHGIGAEAVLNGTMAGPGQSYRRPGPHELEMYNGKLFFERSYPDGGR